MGYRPIQRFGPLNMASGATLTSSMFLGDMSYSFLALDVPSMVSNTDIYVKGSNDDSTYYRAKYPVQSGTVAPGDITIGSGVSSSRIPVQYFDYKYLKVEYSTACTATSHNFYIHIA